jgi:hypothetical protein
MQDEPIYFTCACGRSHPVQQAADRRTTIGCTCGRDYATEGGRVLLKGDLVDLLKLKEARGTPSEAMQHFYRTMEAGD